MQIEHVRLLQIQRDLHQLPRGMERFQEYLIVSNRSRCNWISTTLWVSELPLGLSVRAGLAVAVADAESMA